MNTDKQEKEIFKAPEFQVDSWVDANGNKTSPIKLSDYNGKFKVIYCFQSWCPGCHSQGLPALQKMVEALKDNESVEFLAIQTVFEGHDANTYEKMTETQKKYNLAIPFGHDPGDESTGNRSKILTNYQTGGTPWFIFIDKHDNVVFADFHVNVDNAIAFLKTI
ncbi:peroxiredoxin family protein [Joostella sp.]|uniref:peroxiredoxin family protein n=1 Tax=Joostella sp. TaxID=2231138 RepID=UPI003A904216